MAPADTTSQSPATPPTRGELSSETSCETVPDEGAPVRAPESVSAPTAHIL